LDNIIDGVVLTFTDITERLAAITEREARKLAEAVVNTVREPLVVLDSALNVVSASQSLYHHFHVTPEDTVNHPLHTLGNHQWDIPALRDLLEKVSLHSQNFEDHLVEGDFPAIGHQRLLLNARRIIGKTGSPQFILLSMKNIPDAH
jgi:two-component system CheB/CheR fusion protein